MWFSKRSTSTDVHYHRHVATYVTNVGSHQLSHTQDYCVCTGAGWCTNFLSNSCVPAHGKCWIFHKVDLLVACIPSCQGHLAMHFDTALRRSSELQIWTVMCLFILPELKASVALSGGRNPPRIFKHTGTFLSTLDIKMIRAMNAEQNVELDFSCIKQTSRGSSLLI